MGEGEAREALFWRALGEAGYIPDYEHIQLGVIAEWIALNHDIVPKKWNAMVDRACERYLVEKALPTRSHSLPRQTFEEIKTSDSIAASELGGAVERIIAAAFGWTPIQVDNSSK